MFDNHTLAFLMQPGMVAALLAQLVNWRINPETPGIKWWSIGMAVQTAGVIVRAQPPFMAEAAIVPLVNLLLVSGQFAVLYGLCQFAGRPMFTRTALASIVLQPLAQLYFVAVEDSLTARTGLQVAVLGLVIGPRPGNRSISICAALIPICDPPSLRRA